MQIEKSQEGNTLSVALIGQLNAETSLMLKEALEQREDLNVRIDFAQVDFISSAGLRVLLTIHKECMAQDCVLTVFNCNAVVTNVFAISGFDKVLNVEN